MKLNIGLYIIEITVLMGCNSSLQCERYYLPKDYIGDVVIYYNQKDGQKSVDKQGCKVYNISFNGKCLTRFPLVDGVAVVHKTIRYFEVDDKKIAHEISEFEPTEYYGDSVKNSKKKYVYFIESGYQNPYYIKEYFVDYGVNHKKYNNF
jgi:hypothetical protein